MTFGATVYVGVGGRTNGAAVRRLREALRPGGAEVVPVPLTRVLHLTSAVTALPDGTVIGHPPLVDHPTLFPRFLPVPEEVVRHQHPVAAVVRRHQRVREARGCVTCLSVRLRALP